MIYHKLFMHRWTRLIIERAKKYGIEPAKAWGDVFFEDEALKAELAKRISAYRAHSKQTFKLVGESKSVLDDWKPEIEV